MKIILTKDHKIADLLQEQLGDDYLVVVTTEIEKAIEVYEV